MVITFVQFFCETANRCIVYTVRLRVRIFAVVQKAAKSIGGYFDAEYVRHHKNRQISLHL